MAERGRTRKKTPTLSDVLIGVPPAAPIPMPARGEAALKRINPIKLKQMQDEAHKMEERIAQLEAIIQKAEAKLSEFVSADEAVRLSKELELNRNELETSMAKWEQLTQEIEATA